MSAMPGTPYEWNCGTRQESCEEERGASGAAYLRSLKQTDGTAKPGDRTSDVVPERRRSVRYRCDGSAEFRTAGTDIRTWGTLADVSMHGCYVEMTATSPVGTVVELTLDAAGIRVHATGEVKVSYPFLGMGIALKVPGEEQAGLREMLQRLSARASISSANDNPSRSGPDAMLPTFAEAGEFVKRIARFFDAHSSLSKDEFLRLLGHRSESG